MTLTARRARLWARSPARWPASKAASARRQPDWQQAFLISRCGLTARTPPAWSRLWAAVSLLDRTWGAFMSKRQLQAPRLPIGGVFTVGTFGCVTVPGSVVMTKAANRYGKRIGKATEMILRRKSQLEAIVPLREKAYREAVKFIGVMEQGGNNAGLLWRSIAEGGGLADRRGADGSWLPCTSAQAEEPWCGSGRGAAVSAGWHQARIEPERGDLVVHVRSRRHVRRGATTDRNRDDVNGRSNTGASGAVSDSKTGGDGGVPQGAFQVARKGPLEGDAMTRPAEKAGGLTGLVTLIAIQLGASESLTTILSRPPPLSLGL